MNCFCYYCKQTDNKMVLQDDTYHCRLLWIYAIKIYIICCDCQNLCFFCSVIYLNCLSFAFVSLCTFRSPFSLCVSFSCVLSHRLHHPPGVFHCVISQTLSYLNSSSSVVQSQLVMCFMSFFPAITCLISWFDPFCVSWSDSVFCYDLTSCFWTLLVFQTFDFGLLFCCFYWTALFDPLPVT